MAKKLEGIYAPSHAQFLPKSTDQNFEIAILFRIVENHNNSVFGDDLRPTVPGGGGCSSSTNPLFALKFDYFLQLYFLKQ